MFIEFFDNAVQLYTRNYKRIFNWDPPLKLRQDKSEIREHECTLCLVAISAKGKINYIYLTITVSIKKPCFRLFPYISLGRLVAASAPGPAAAADRVVGVFASASVSLPRPLLSLPRPLLVCLGLC
jgi:hypothetical protein